MGKRVLIISTSLDCFEKAELKGIVTGGGINDPFEAVKHTDAMTKAYELGVNL